jgi:maltooligosyltrehalose synthase
MFEPVREHGLPLPSDVWSNTVLELTDSSLSRRQYRDVLSGRTFDPRNGTRLDELFATYPVAALLAD